MNQSSKGERSYSDDEALPPPPRKHRPHPAHGGAWKVAYADFVTAMMALFIVLWVMTQNEPVKKSVAAYFSDPVGFNKSGGRIIETIPSTVNMTERTIDVDVGRTDRLEQEVARMKSLLEQNAQVAPISDQVVIQVTDEGIRLEFRDASKFSFFAIGSAQVTPQLKEIIRTLTPEISQTSYGIIIEGHTDRRPYVAGATYTNWELSADRGNGVRRLMVEGGLSVDRINEVRSYADTRPLNEKDPFSIENRRVSILLKDPLVKMPEK